MFISSTRPATTRRWGLANGRDGRGEGEVKVREGRGLSRPSRAGGDHRAELRGTVRVVGRSAVELAAEPGPGAAPDQGQIAAAGLCGGHRLSPAARTGPRLSALAHPRLGLGPRAPEYFPGRTHRDREELRGLCLGRKGLPGWIYGPLHASPSTVSRPGLGPYRWEPTQFAGPVGPSPGAAG